MKQHVKIFERMSQAADLSAVPLPGLPLVEVFGENRVLIENHSGVTEYGCNKICVKVSYGQLCVCGSCLMLAQMTNQQMIITGQIESISLLKRR